MGTLIGNTPAAWDARARVAGTSWDAAMWSQSSQSTRFFTVRSMLKISEGDTVLDFGCGTGAFVDYLPAEDWVSYYAHDWSPEMRARVRREHPRAVVVPELDEDLVFDHVVCIGTFNLSDNWSKEETWETLVELWTMHTRCSLVVSLFCERGRTPSNMLGYSPTEVCSFIERIGSPSFSLRTDHLPNDLTLGVFYEPGRDRAPAELPPGDVGHLEDQGV